MLWHVSADVAGFAARRAQPLSMLFTGYLLLDTWYLMHKLGPDDHIEVSSLLSSVVRRPSVRPSVARRQQASQACAMMTSSGHDEGWVEVFCGQAVVSLFTDWTGIFAALMLVCGVRQN